MAPMKLYNAPQRPSCYSEDVLALPKLFLHLQRSLQTFANLHRPLDILQHLQRPLDTYVYLKDTSHTLGDDRDLRRWIGRVTLDGGVLTPILLQH
jgi:hypothetical protein